MNNSDNTFEQNINMNNEYRGIHEDFEVNENNLNNLTLTNNGGISLKTTNNVIVDYFMLFMRDLDIETNYDYLEKCWDKDPKKTVAIIFNGRDRDKGKKEKRVSNDAMIWLRKNKFNTYASNISKYVEKYGCWKDLNYISYKLKNKDQYFELKLFADKLMEDKINMENNKSVSLCAKWASSENDKYDKKKQYAKKIATIIYGKIPNKMEAYRKEYLVPLRTYINIVEKKMCSEMWGDIDYEKVPSIASNKLKNAFLKHDEERYKKYLEDVRNNKKKINVKGILPHELVANYIKSSYDIENIDNIIECETTELQWRTIVENVKKSGNFNNSISIVDLSGSMFSAANGSIPAQVAIALGIITSICCKGQFNNKLITFSEEPEIINLSNEENDIPKLIDCIKIILKTEYGFSTDFIKCNKLIINYAKLFNVPNENMPKKMFVFTDMQFNNASNNSQDLDTIYKKIIKKYSDNCYDAPKFIFWNLNSNSKEVFPVNCDTEGTAIISGFSEQLLKIFMYYDDFKPEIVINEILEPYIKEVIISDD
jgi:hypothetical protein